MKEKLEKIIYPTMMVFCLISAISSYATNEDYTWPLLTFSWVAIAWGNTKK